MYNMINIYLTLLYIMKVKRVNPKCSHHKEKYFFSFSFILHLYGMVDVH